MSSLDDDEQEPGGSDSGGDDGSQDGNDTPGSESENYDQQFEEMQERFNQWADENGFERATGLREEIQEIIDRYRVDTGDFSGLDDFKIPDKDSEYSLLDRPETSNYHLVQVDPRAFDFVNLEIYAWDRGYRVTAALEGKHGEFSFHYDGRAIDVSVAGMTKEQIDAMKKDFSSHGLRIYDETDRSKWTSDTTGYHLHVDTGTRSEVLERTEWHREGLSREDVGLGTGWPLRIRK